MFSISRSLFFDDKNFIDNVSFLLKRFKNTENIPKVRIILRNFAIPPLSVWELLTIEKLDARVVDKNYVPNYDKKFEPLKPWWCSPEKINNTPQFYNNINQDTLINKFLYYLDSFGGKGTNGAPFNHYSDENNILFWNISTITNDIRNCNGIFGSSLNDLLKDNIPDNYIDPNNGNTAVKFREDALVWSPMVGNNETRTINQFLNRYPNYAWACALILWRYKAVEAKVYNINAINMSPYERFKYMRRIPKKITKNNQVEEYVGQDQDNFLDRDDFRLLTDLFIICSRL